MPEYSPVRSSGSNGVIERGIKEVQGQLRAMNSALDTRVGVDIRETSNILPWMVEYASEADSAKLDSLWQTGLFVGYRTHSGEFMVANSEGNKSEIEGMSWTTLEVQDE